MAEPNINSIINSVKTNYQKGVDAEKKALSALSNFKIIGQRIKNRHGEIDILAQKNNDYYIFEVKTRKSHQKALESVNLKQITRCINAFFYYAQENNLKYEQIYIKAITIVGEKIEIIDINELENLD